MRITYSKNKAFSLMELIIVLVIIALLFAAMAPIITKRHIVESGSVDKIWNFVSNDTERNSYFDPGAENWTSSVYVGMDPIANYNGAGKLVINSQDINYAGVAYPQPQIQFRFSQNEDVMNNGIDSGSLLVTNNLYFGQIRNINGTNNTVLGLEALQNAQQINNSVAVGTGAMSNYVSAADPNTSHYTVVGSNAAQNGAYEVAGNYLDTIFIGTGAGKDVQSLGEIGIGNHAGNINASGENVGGNIAIGSNTGSISSDGASVIDNVLVDTVFSNNSNGATYNTIIGRNSYLQRSVESAHGDDESHLISFLTAIGGNACNSIKPESGFVTCLGYNSGASVGNTPEYRNDYNSSSRDEHIFLGGVPKGGFGGRAVMEIHNYHSADDDTIGEDADVVLNSNLVVRGKLYADYGYVENTLPRYKFVDTKDNALGLPLEPDYYRCISDLKGPMMLVYNVYYCTDEYNDLDVSLAPPKTINMLMYEGGSNNSIMMSDKRAKTDIVENNDGLSKILLINPYHYTFKSDIFGVPQVGVIAQDLQKVFPASVSNDKKGFLQIRLDEMFYAMINSIKELSQKVENTARKIASALTDVEILSGKNKKIKKQLSSLDKRIRKLERNN